MATALGMDDCKLLGQGDVASQREECELRGGPKWRGESFAAGTQASSYCVVEPEELFRLVQRGENRRKTQGGSSCRKFKARWRSGYRETSHLINGKKI